MSVEHIRHVTLTVQDGAHNARFEVEQVHHWPGEPPEHITALIERVCADMIENIRRAEENE